MVGGDGRLNQEVKRCWDVAKGRENKFGDGISQKVVNFRENNLLNVEAGRLEDFERGILF